MEDRSVSTDIDQSTTENIEPQITSNDPNERKLARRLRIERRWENIRRQGMAQMSGEDFVPEEEEPNPIQNQVQDSADLLEKYIIEGEEYVTNVRVASDGREVDRRDAEGINRENVIEELENEAAESQKAFDEIAEKWSTIQTYNDPLHIHEDIMNQKEKCDLVIKQKDEIIAMLKEEVKKAEKKFTKDQVKQMEDIETLAHRIEKQISFMRRAYQKEFEMIEEVILAERQILVDLNNKKWEELYKKRDEREVENSDNKFELLNEFYDSMADMRIAFQEKFRKTKIRLENDIEDLQRELERIKALALLNSEKLDYNYQILKKREDENIIIKSQQKRRINKLQDIINSLTKKIADYENSTNNEINKLRNRIKKLHRSILEVEAKADHFAKINDDKFHQVWDMNRKVCEDILKQILETDRILHEQQLGIPWEPPDYRIEDRLPTFNRDPKAAGSTASITSTKKTEGKKTEDSQYDIVKSNLTVEQKDAHPIYRRLIKHILKHVSDKSGFLTETKLKSVLRPYENEQKTLIRLDNIFESLRIGKKEDIDIMVNYFIPYAYCAKCSLPPEIRPQMSGVMTRVTPSQLSALSLVLSRHDVNNEYMDLEDAFHAICQPLELIDDIVMELVTSEESSEEEPSEVEQADICGAADSKYDYTHFKEKKGATKVFISEEKLLCQYNHPLVISSVYIIKALRCFVTHYYAEREGLPTTRERLEARRFTVSRMLDDEDIKHYWEKFRTIYDEDRIRIWDGLLEGLRKYHEILKDRKILCEEVISLRQQNQDLKRLLGNYMANGVMSNPPCAIEHNKYLKTTSPSYTNAKM